jgi:hypothetical protein
MAGWRQCVGLLAASPSQVGHAETLLPTTSPDDGNLNLQCRENFISQYTGTKQASIER